MKGEMVRGRKSKGRRSEEGRKKKKEGEGDVNVFEVYLHKYMFLCMYIENSIM
jgi:hypothetical protein